MKTALVTGGAGFAGAQIALALRARGLADRVIAFDNLRRRGSELSLSRLKQHGVDFLHGDVRSADDLAEAGPVDLIVECSAEPSVLAGYGGAPAYVTQTNLGGTINCLEHARRHGAGFLFLSTSRVYPIAPLQQLRTRETETRLELEKVQPCPGAGPAGISEAFPLDGPRSLYGATKLCSELIAQEYAAMYGMPLLINRCGLLTGPWQMGKSDQGVIVLWAARHLFGGALKYIGHGGAGKQVRDFLHIDDLVELLALQIKGLGAWRGEVYNVGGGRENSISLCELTALCQRIGGNIIAIGAEAADRPADVPIYLSDTTRLRTNYDWRPTRDAEATLASIFQWLRDNEHILRPILS